MRFVTAFNRDRDFYQVPWALMERSQLECLVTDVYVPDMLARFNFVRQSALGHRTCPGIPSKMVRSCAKAVWMQIVDLQRARTPQERTTVFNTLDATLSRRAGRLAVRRRSGLFLYSGYALEAFTMVEGLDLPKLLFVYHPEGVVAQEIFTKDFAQHPEVADSHRAHAQHMRPGEAERVRLEIAMADAIVCASNITAAAVRGLLGGQNKPVGVVPYGCHAGPTLASRPADSPAKTRPGVLFVGQGNQRKGLHHLIKVWGRGLHDLADLTLVINNTDPGIAKMLEQSPFKPRVLQRLTKQQLQAEYDRADIFVLPSLLEGFGLVYLEALSAGCYVIGTHNTGLPDLQAPADVATVISAGDLEALHSALESGINNAALGQLDRERIHEFARTRSWEAFREGIRSFVRNAESSRPS